VRVEAGVATDIGRVRERNEDSFLVDPPLYAIADGMGGHRGGAVASELALEKVEELARAGKATLTDMVRSANRAVFERSMSDRSVTGMGTTLTAVQVDDDGAHLVHVGDSRAYLLRAGAFRQLTDDHTLVNRMVRAGEITREEADVHPHRNVLTRVVGTEPDVDVDEDDIPVMDGDRILICSDGLTNMVAEDQIQAILEATPTSQETADRLIKAANRAGGIDNTTVVVLAILEGTDDAAEEPATNTPSKSIGRPSAAAVKRWSLRAAVVGVALAALFVLGRGYIDRQWYVGEASGHVAVYQGIPAEPAGIPLSHVELETDIPADQASALQFYGDLPDGITANSRDEALAIVEQIRSDVKAAEGTAP
jgi:serine/threonine protein phosphatase PrpC